MTGEYRKEMKDVSTSNVSRKPLQCIDVTIPVASHVIEVMFETIAMPMVCSLIEHGFLSVFSMVGKIMLHSDSDYLDCIPFDNFWE